MAKKMKFTDIEDCGGGRGLNIIHFNDIYSESCSLQTSSLATAEALWFGAGDNRMHIDRRGAAMLAVLLQGFADTGNFDIQPSSVDVAGYPSATDGDL